MTYYSPVFPMFLLHMLYKVEDIQRTLYSVRSVPIESMQEELFSFNLLF